MKRKFKTEIKKHGKGWVIHITEITDGYKVAIANIYIKNNKIHQDTWISRLK